MNPNAVCKSAVSIAKALDVEGFSPSVVQGVKRYWRRRATDRQNWIKRGQRAKKAFSEMVKEKLDDRDRAVLGRYLTHFAAINFEAGLSVGLGCSITVGNSADNGHDRL